MFEFGAKKCMVCGRIYATGNDFLRGTNGWRICSNEALWFECSCSSTLMLPKGKYEWYSPTDLMASEAAAFFNRMPQLKSLPHVPSRIAKIQQAARDTEIELEDFTKILRQDAGLVAKILMMASNIRSARGDHALIESLEHAVVFLGRNQISDFVMAIAIQAFPLKSMYFKSDDFWQRAYLSGAVAEWLGARLNQSHLKDELYVCGTLCNIGKLVGAMQFPDQVDAIRMAQRNPRSADCWTNLERRLECHPHTILGEIAAVLWGLPKYVAHTCANHHGVLQSSRPVDRKDEIRTHLVGLANQIVHWLFLEPELIEKSFQQACADFFALKESDLEVMVQDLMPLKANIESFVSDIAS